jgi:hypothetical protein
MNIIDLKEINNLNTTTQEHKLLTKFKDLLTELKTKNLSVNSITAINKSVELINTTQATGNDFVKLIKQQQALVLKTILKEDKLSTKNYYRTIFMLFGLTGIGLPIGVAIGIAMKNMGLMGLGLPIGMAIGMLLGISKDKKALAEGKQLNVDLTIK